MEVPQFFIGGCFGTGAGELSPGKRYSDQKPNEHFTIDDLLDFSNEDAMVTDGFFDNVAGSSTDSSMVTVIDSCNSSVCGGEPRLSGNRSFGDSQFSGDLCVPVSSTEFLKTCTEQKIDLLFLQNTINSN